MNWIIIVAIVLLAERDYIHNLNLILGTDAGPVPITGPFHNINPFILHWEPAHFDRSTLERAHQKHLKQLDRRRKRDLGSNNYEAGPAHTIKLKFSAHDREFRLVLHQDPLSVFAPDVEIENTMGPVDYDMSRIYTGSLEDDENSRIHAVLTQNNLIDGTISTNTEQYYIEPSERYSNDLIKSGIHTIVYKLSDVKMNKKLFSNLPQQSANGYPSSSSSSSSTDAATPHHCASENLRKKLETQRSTKDFKRRKKSSVKESASSTASSPVSSSSSSASSIINPFYLNSNFYDHETSNHIGNIADDNLSSFAISSLKLAAPLANNKIPNNHNHNNNNRKNIKKYNLNSGDNNNDDDEDDYDNNINDNSNYDDGSGSGNVINIINSDTIRDSKSSTRRSGKSNNYENNSYSSNGSSSSSRIPYSFSEESDRTEQMSQTWRVNQMLPPQQTSSSSQNNLINDASDFQIVNESDDKTDRSPDSFSNANLESDFRYSYANKDGNWNDVNNFSSEPNRSADSSSIPDSSLSRARRKRWLPEELSDNRDPPLPLDLDVPYNDEYSLLTANADIRTTNNNNNSGSTTTRTTTTSTTVRTNSRENLIIGIGRSPSTYHTFGSNAGGGGIMRNLDIRNNHNLSGSGNSGIIGNTFNSNSNSNSNSNINSNSNSGDIITGSGIYSKQNRNRNILVNQYSPNNNPNSDFTNNFNSNINNNNNNNNYNYKSNISNNGRQNNYNINHRNIIGNSYNGDNSNLNANTKIRTIFNTNFDLTNHNANSNSNSNNNFNPNSGSNSSPSHKTHVEIITRNGATKRPNIIGSNYNPDVYLTNTKGGKVNSHLNLNVRNELDGSSSTSARPSLYDRKSTCMLYLQADHTFFQKMGSDEASIEAITRHVQRANTIYRNTDFNNDGKPDNITFMIKRIKVHNANAVKDPSYRFPGNYGVEKFLELFSEEDYDAFCLAYMFTYRDFEMGTLGLAWTGDLKNAGGVCEKNGHYRGSLKSLNTGIVTLLNYGKHVPPAVSHVTLAHEIGHNFGSPHDPEQCTPGGEDGNYIMFARATSGDKRNNNKFSPCSLKSIEPVLNAKARSAKGCFTEPQTSICGNGVVEPGEECDCGWEEDCNDICCFPMSRHPRIDERPCTLQPRAMCSPSQGPCCTTHCNLKFGDKCRDDNGCRDPSFCDGRQPHCPASVNKPNKTICNKEFVCYMGECTGSICLAFGLESCQCLPGPNDPKTKSCELCCKEPGESKPCKSSFEWNEQPYDVPDMFAKPGTPCNDYNGYCDVFQKCREVDPSGPLATLRKLLLSEESIATFKKWVQSNWYTVVLAAVGVIVLLILSTKLLGKRNVKLKSVTIIHSATTETVRLPEDNNGVIVHTAVRTKVPFKKKVRGQRSHKAKIITKKSTQQKISSKPTTKGGKSAPSTPFGPSSPMTAVATTSISANKNSPTATTTTIIPKIPSAIIANNKSSGEVLKKVVRKKNRTGVDDKTNAKIMTDMKKTKKSKKKKEIIDYSKAAAGPNPANTHTNTFGKVQKWLLDSPIVSQPPSHVEHSSTTRNLMTKSQSTPDRLTQKSPQKSKSVGNLSNEKVKLQVVYKPPFKFSLKLSKNPTVKTHVLGGALSKSKRKIRIGAVDKKKVGVAPHSGSKSSEERGRRAALLIRSVDQTDGLKLNLMEHSEPNYETLEHPDKMSDKTPLYENMQINSTENLNKVVDAADADLHKSAGKLKAPDVFRINRSASNSQIDRAERATKSQQPHSYSRSNSVSHNAGAAALRPISSSRKTSDNSVNLSRNFGSTQNLIPTSQSNLTKSKKRSSLNLKNNSVSASSDTKRPSLSKKPLTPETAVPVAARRSNSNQNIRRDSSSSNVRRSENIDAVLSQQQRGSNSNLFKSPSSGNLKGSIKNIPRASLSNNSATHALLIGASQQLNNLNSTNGSQMYHQQQQLQQKHRTPSPPNNLLIRQQSHNPSQGYSVMGNQASGLNYNNLNKPHSAGCDDFNNKQSTFEWPKNLATCAAPQMQQQQQETGATQLLPSSLLSATINQNNRNSYTSHNSNTNNSNNSSSNNSISNNFSNSSSSSSSNNITSNAAISPNNVSSHHNNSNFLLKPSMQIQHQQHPQQQHNRNLSPMQMQAAAAISNATTTANPMNNFNYNDQKINLGLSNAKNFNNRLSSISKSSSASLLSKQIDSNNEPNNLNNSSIASSDTQAAVVSSDVANLVS